MRVCVCVCVCCARVLGVCGGVCVDVVCRRLSAGRAPRAGLAWTGISAVTGRRWDTVWGRNVRCAHTVRVRQAIWLSGVQFAALQTWWMTAQQLTSAVGVRDAGGVCSQLEPLPH